MPHNLFVYGTLQFPQIVKKVCGKTFPSESAVLFEYKRVKVKNCDYPAIIPSPGSKVMGQIFEHVDEASLNALDFFEGEEYMKKEVLVEVNKSEIKAVTYIWNTGINLLESDDWDYERFRKESLKEYI